MIGCVITRRVSEFAQPRANLLYAASLPDHNNLQDDAPCGRQIVVGTPLGGDIGDDVVDSSFRMFLFMLELSAGSSFNCS